MKAFLFLYPITEYFNHEINCGAHFYDSSNAEKDKDFLLELDKVTSEEEKEMLRQRAYNKAKAEFRQRYKRLLNDCIDLRYRKNGFEIVYALFSGHTVSDVINLKPTDRTIDVGMSFKTHWTKAGNVYHYPDNDFILDQLRKINVLRVGGFHSGDCVDKLARMAHERGLDTLVDEDLTDYFKYRILSSSTNFCIDEFKPFDIEGLEGDALEHLGKARGVKPWLTEV